LLLVGNVPVGAARLDLMDDAAAGVRTVAIKPSFQRKGFGRILLKGLEEFASQHGSKTLIVKAARDAVGFYEAPGWTIFEGRCDNPVLTKELRAHP
jgi:GNAT superfamily N-acetyltransferase